MIEHRPTDRRSDPATNDAAGIPPAGGLAPDELSAEQASDLPDREALSLVSVGGLETSLPLPVDLDEVIQRDPPAWLGGGPAVDPLDGQVDDLLDGGPLDDGLTVTDSPADEPATQPAPAGWPDGTSTPA